MKLFYILLISVAWCNAPSSALRCWRCDNARSPEECKEKGHSQQCRFTEKVCQTEVRYSVGWGNRPNIRTSCKEAHACANNLVQNPRGAWIPSQCNKGKFNSVCRCCCTGSHCNLKDLLCEPKDEPEITTTPTPPLSDVPMPTCRRYPIRPNHGKVSCSNRLFVSSICSFTCDEGFGLVGSKVATCTQFRRLPMWNRRSPVCRKIVERCGPLVTPTNGQDECEGSGELGTTCKFLCDDQYTMEGPSETTCISSSKGPQWSNRAPRCFRKCDYINSPENGGVHCVGSGEVGKSYCTFFCNPGLSMEGSQATHCIETAKGAEWTHDVPRCVVKCDRVVAPRNGNATCTGSGEAGKTHCTFHCKDGSLLDGPQTIYCNDVFGIAQWSDRVPQCVDRCEALAAPTNGFVECAGSGDLGTSCMFACNEGTELVGATTTECDMTSEGLRWTNPAPTCSDAIRRCPDLGSLQHGNITCDGDRNALGTRCSFQCFSEGYTLLPSNRFDTECRFFADGELNWSNKKPCCSSTCPPVAKKDIVMVIDSSRSISNKEWRRMTAFLVELIRTFEISDSSVRVAAFRFNRQVDTKSQILFGDYNTVDELTDAVSNIPKNGGGTKIGNALRHAKNVVLKTGNRPDVKDMVFILTDGQSKDKFRDTAKELRDSGVKIVALGVFRKNRKRFVQELTEMTGDRDLVIEVGDIIESFKDELVKLVAEKICEVSCE